MKIEALNAAIADMDGTRSPGEGPDAYTVGIRLNSDEEMYFGAIYAPKDGMLKLDEWVRGENCLEPASRFRYIDIAAISMIWKIVD